ncbi:MAG: DNA repair protein RecN [Betaproteobacteria bacterium]|nr:DNA repair protein RecN [Betaproteobacteria bacterium]MCH9849022.1 DNA repair protein RecN [Betaproteobacteria bacterium]
MLQALSIQNFVIVEQLDLEFSQGFTTLTGETGAGKSILIDALSLALGARNEGEVVRSGCDKADISVTVGIQHNQAAQLWLSENDLEAADDLILRRVIYSDGRSRGFINGAAATVGQLKALGEYLVDIYSQNAHHSLLNINTQRQILDAFSGSAALVKQVADYYKTWHKLHLQQSEIEKNAAAYADELAELRDKLRELTQLNFVAEKWEELQLEHSRLSNSAELISGVEASLHLVSEGDVDALSMLAHAQQKLLSLLELDSQLTEAAETIDSAVIQLQEAARSLNRYLQRDNLDPERLTEVENRIQAVHGIARKYRVRPDELPELLATWQLRMTELESFANDGELAKQVAAALESYMQSAKALSAARQQSAQDLSAKISAEMQRLSLSGGQFQVALEPCEQSSNGLEQVAFLVAGHAGVEPRSLNKVASGGELSRISLALHVTTAAQGSVPCMIFDEVDVGIGGGVAEVVGKLLKQLGENRQVLVITHLAQVAAQAAQHLQVSKTQTDGKTLSHIQRLSDAERIEEVARMSGGLEITDATRNHAKEMLGL